MTVTTPSTAAPDPSPTPRRPPPAPAVAGVVGAPPALLLLVWLGIGAVLLTANLVSNGVWGELDASSWDGQARSSSTPCSPAASWS